MDGPNMNWKTVKIIKEYGEHNDPDGPDLSEIGSCGLGNSIESYRLEFRYFVESNLFNFQIFTSLKGRLPENE